ncbi:conserved hypothetical protein [Methanocella paludicola SANAE]|uniref:ATPase AAA-type core domain-containing protein n=1 Tax=Methanocella paludicola (strain DSM 17711 / JCM 13418 / NBRC 101707 / SANAE) TaxID=304371 RepID=D1Z0R3_METPS|nr:conserved hypothetical protein [Methanocella paludicola SANAE]
MVSIAEARNKRSSSYEVKGISKISVAGFKSIYDEKSISIYPLTILSGSNSSGKSSIFQPLLMMKQTMEESYDPGDLLIDGPHVRYYSAKEFLSKIGNEVADKFSITIEVDGEKSIRETFKRGKNKPVELVEASFTSKKSNVRLKPGMDEKDLIKKYWFFNDQYESFRKSLNSFILDNKRLSDNGIDTDNLNIGLKILRKRCMLNVVFSVTGAYGKAIISPSVLPIPGFEDLSRVENHILGIIHVPTLRGNPQRVYKTTAVGPQFPGTLDNYVASIINHWKVTNNPALNKLGNWLKTLGLTWKIDAKQINDTQVEILLHRLPKKTSDPEDMVNIADVGFGVSQVLPVLVALLVAKRDQIVYIEQPEIHLHPRAQYKLAEMLVETANRGVKVVIETHSMLLLTGIQTYIAEGKITTDNVKLHWFSRNDDGVTDVISTSFDKRGSFGECPIDFAEIELEADSRYLDASELHPVD